MFDAPDLSPLCVAPFLGIVLGAFIYSIGSIIRLIIKRKTKNDESGLRDFISVLALSIGIIICITSLFAPVSLFNR